MIITREGCVIYGRLWQIANNRRCGRSPITVRCAMYARAHRLLLLLLPQYMVMADGCVMRSIYGRVPPCTVSRRVPCPPANAHCHACLMMLPAAAAGRRPRVVRSSFARRSCGCICGMSIRSVFSLILIQLLPPTPLPTAVPLLLRWLASLARRASASLLASHTAAG